MFGYALAEGRGVTRPVCTSACAQNWPNTLLGWNEQHMSMRGIRRMEAIG